MIIVTHSMTRADGSIAAKIVSPDVGTMAVWPVLKNEDGSKYSGPVLPKGRIQGVLAFEPAHTDAKSGKEYKDAWLLYLPNTQEVAKAEGTEPEIVED